MTGWLLIFVLLLLGGVLATLGDRLGTRVGKARLSIFKLRPKKTAILITVLTGSLISAISLSFMLVVSRQLRVGLFELDDIQARLRESRSAIAPLQKERKLLEARINKGEMELRQLERNLFALRRGEVVISSGQSIIIETLNITSKEQVQQAISMILDKANKYAILRAKPIKSKSNRILMIRRDHIQKLEKIISKKGSWVVNIRSAGNVLRGENYVYAFPEVIKNKNIVNKGEILAKSTINKGEFSSNIIREKIKLLLASTLAEAKRRGSLASQLQLDANEINRIGIKLKRGIYKKVQIEAISRNKSDTADKISITLKINSIEKE